MVTRYQKTQKLSFLKPLKETLAVTVDEFRHVFRDPGVLIIFVAASLLYPLLYCSIYKNETLYDLPVAVVDDSQTVRSRQLIRALEATPELKISGRFNNLGEAQNAFHRHEVHGVIRIPADYADRINRLEQATVSMYSDMSSFMYYRTMMLGVNYAVLDVGGNIKTERLHAQGITGESAALAAEPMRYSDHILYNSGMGFASFLMPAVLILIIHQTLFFGIGMLAGTAREENRFHELFPVNGRRRNLIRLIAGKSLCYLSLYLVLSAYILGVIPRLFNLPHIGNPESLFGLLVPFLLATIFFSMTISIFIRNRETGMVLFLFFSLILLFLSGFSWPRSNISGFWLAFSWLFPATHGIQGYIKINTMGATLQQIRLEYVSLWAQAAFYFVTTLVVFGWQLAVSRRRHQPEEASGALSGDPSALTQP